MSPTKAVAVLLLLIIGLSGCISAKDFDASAEGGADGESAGGETEAASPTSWSWSSGGYTSEDQQGSVVAPGGGASLSYSAGGSGSVTVTVEDGEGEEVYHRSIGANGGASENTRLTGAPGNWSIEVDFGSWSGGFTIQVQGH